MLIKQLLLKNKLLLRLAAIAYNFLHYNNAWKYRMKNSICFSGAFLKNVTFDIRGCNNRVFIKPLSRLSNCKITIIGNNCLYVNGGGHTIVSGTSFWLQDDNTQLIIGDDFMSGNGTHIAASEGASITIGNDCMLSEDVEIRSSDSHSIFDTVTKKRINRAKLIIIGNHVWITAHVRILKGTTIASNSIIGNSSVLCGHYDVPNSLYVGNPCRKMKESVDWSKWKTDEMR